VLNYRQTLETLLLILSPPLVLELTITEFDHHRLVGAIEIQNKLVDHRKS
jgi:hypothetical protein